MMVTEHDSSGVCYIYDDDDVLLYYWLRPDGVGFDPC